MKALFTQPHSITVEDGLFICTHRSANMTCENCSAYAKRVAENIGMSIEPICINSESAKAVCCHCSGTICILPAYESNKVGIQKLQ